MRADQDSVEKIPALIRRLKEVNGRLAAWYQALEQASKRSVPALDPTQPRPLKLVLSEKKQVAFQQMTQGSEIRITGTIPATLSDFKVDPPSLLAIPVKNEIPVSVDMTWRPE